MFILNKVNNKPFQSAIDVAWSPPLSGRLLPHRAQILYCLLNNFFPLPSTTNRNSDRSSWKFKNTPKVSITLQKHICVILIVNIKLERET